MTDTSAEITWHADPTVAVTARLGSYGADVWDNCDGTHGWVVYPLGVPSDLPAHRAPSFEAAKAQAGEALRLAAAMIT